MELRRGLTGDSQHDFDQFCTYNQNLFHVESNSTVSALTFNSTSSELSFAVSGPNDISGYVKATITKSLISNAKDTRVYLDEKQLNYTVSSTDNSWILIFVYHHSAHQVTIQLTANTNAGAEPAILGAPYWMGIAVAGVVIVPIASFIALRRMKNRKIQLA